MEQGNLPLGGELRWETSETAGRAFKQGSIWNSGSMWNSGSSPGLPSAGSVRADRGTGASGGLEELRLQRRRLRLSDHVCKHLMGMWREQALLQLPRDRPWSRQCPKVLAGSVSSAALGQSVYNSREPRAGPPLQRGCNSD